MSRNQQRGSRKENKGNILQTKEQYKSLEENLNKMEINDLLNREFKITVIKMLTEVTGIINEQNENFNEETENT